MSALSNIPPRPLLIIHGTADRITPLKLGRELFACAAEPKFLRVVQGGRHLTPWVHERQAFEESLCEFFARALEHPK